MPLRSALRFDKIKKTSTLFFLLLSIPFGTAFSKINTCQPIGFVQEDGTCSISYDFGIEQYEDGKRIQDSFQKWHINVRNFPGKNGRMLNAVSVERMIFENMEGLGAGYVINTWPHSTEDRTLEINNIDWVKGSLHFSLVFFGTSKKIDVLMKIKYDSERMIYLDYFKSYCVSEGISNETLSSVEYRIPQYTFTARIPVKMNGFKSENDREWDGMYFTLSKEDRQVLDNNEKLFRFADNAYNDEELAGILKKKIPDIYDGKRKLSPAEYRTTEKLRIEYIVSKVLKQGMSKEGALKLRKFMAEVK